MEQIFVVEKNQTAEVVGSGLLPVLSTPSLVAMVENTCFKSLTDQLDTGETTVGVKMEMDHLKGSLVGEKIKITTELLKTGKKSFLFSFAAFADKELIAKGQHLRVKVVAKDFMENLNKK